MRKQNCVSHEKITLCCQNDEIILFWSYYAKKLTIIIKLPKEEVEDDGVLMPFTFEELARLKFSKFKQLGNSLIWHVPILYNGILRWRIINWTFRNQTVKSHHPKVSTGLHLVPQVDIFIQCHLDGVSRVGRWIGRTCVDIKCKVEVTESLWNDISLSNR